MQGGWRQAKRPKEGKIRNVMLAAPDVDFDVFRRQVAAMGPAERTAAKDLAERQVPRLVGVAGDD